MSASAYERVNGGAEEDFGDDNNYISGTSTIGHPILPVIRPSVYYDEGPFDPPSSDDEDEGLIEKQDHVLVSEELDTFNDTEPGKRARLGGNKVSGSPLSLIFCSRLYQRGLPA
jgi:dipeptidyl aminopeptidase